MQRAVEELPHADVEENHEKKAETFHAEVGQLERNKNGTVFICETRRRETMP